MIFCAADYAHEQHDPKEADLVGINMEGPFISRVKKGAQNEDYIIPCDVSVCESFLEASRGLVKIIGLAPEENPNFRQYIASVKDRVRVSLAHTNADYETAMAAFEAGACHAVHLFNAMPPMSHRSPGVVGAVRDSDQVMAELICDGNHVHPAVVRAAFDMLGEERIILISDSLRACGRDARRCCLQPDPVPADCRQTDGNPAGEGAAVRDIQSGAFDRDPGSVWNHRSGKTRRLRAAGAGGSQCAGGDQGRRTHPGMKPLTDLPENENVSILE